MNQTMDLDSFIEAIPDSRQIRERLSENLREARLLRRLLKLANDKPGSPDEQRVKRVLRENGILVSPDASQ